MRTQTTTVSSLRRSSSRDGTRTASSHQTTSNSRPTADPLAGMLTQAKRPNSNGSMGSSNNSSFGSSSRSRDGGEIMGHNTLSSSYNQDGSSGVVPRRSSGGDHLPPIHPTSGVKKSTSPLVNSRRLSGSSNNSGKNTPITSPLMTGKRTVTEFGMTIEEAALEKWKATVKKNTSPFDANMFLPMLKDCPATKKDKITLVLDIDETLVHSSLKPRDGDYVPDTVVTIAAGGQTGNIYVKYRPHVKQFLEAVAPWFEVVVFTASQSQYANQLMDTLDTSRVVTDRLFREHCTEVNGARVKDLTLLGRSLDRMVILDNSPVAYLFQQRNAIPILSWFDDPSDTELLKLIPFLRELSTQKSVYPMLDVYNVWAAQGSKNNSPSTPGIAPLQ